MSKSDGVTHVEIIANCYAAEETFNNTFNDSGNKNVELLWDGLKYWGIKAGLPQALMYFSTEHVDLLT